MTPLACAFASACLFWLLMAVALCTILTGCGTSSDRQTRTVERLETQTGPLIVDTPMGQFTAQPVRHVSLRSTDEVERSKTQIDAPEVGQITTAAISGSPLGPALGILGLAAAAATGWKALQNGKRATRAEGHRDQLIDGIEKSSEDMPDAEWAKMRATLAAKQDNDLQQVIRTRTA